MSFNSIDLLVVDAERLVDCVLSRAEGGSTLERGVSDLVRDLNPDVSVSVTISESSGLGQVLTGLRSKDFDLLDGQADIVLLSLAGEVSRFASEEPAAEIVDEVRADLVSCIELIKEQSDARVLVANLSTLDPENPVYNYRGLAQEPFGLVAHRLNLMLLGVSHDEGVSVVDVDRKIAEAGGDEAVSAAARYTEIGCSGIAAEIARIIEDYGFLDDRPLMEQVGARAGRAS